MTARRLALAWSAGCSVGYLVGWLAGSNVLRMTEAHRLGRPRTPESGPVRLPEPRTAPEGIPGHPDAGSALTAAIPAQRDDEPCPVTLGPLTCPFTGPHINHAFQSATSAPDAKDDADERIE